MLALFNPEAHQGSYDLAAGPARMSQEGLLNGNMLQILQNADVIISFDSKGKTAVRVHVNICSELSFNMWNEISEKALNQILCKCRQATAVERDALTLPQLLPTYA